VVALAVAAVVLAPPGKVSAAFPGANGRIAFDDTFSHNIYTVLPDGTHQRQLTTDGHSVGPRWSPNGRKIAFSRRGELWVMDADGTHQHRVGAVTRGYQPAWSPDARRLVYVHVPVGKKGDIWTVSVSGGTPQRITHDAATSCGDAHPVFSPLGGSIAYDQQPGTPMTSGCADVGEPRVYVQDLSTGTRYAIANARNPDYLADGRGLVFTGDVEPDGTAFPANLYASNLRGAVSGRMRLSDALCVEGEPCFSEGAAAPSSTLAAPAAVWLETLVTGQYCFESKVAGAGYCKAGAARFFPENIDWQP
jgi:hypothetical protein